MKWLKRHIGVVVLYCLFLFCLTLYVRGRIIYRNVENWPSVPATEVTQLGDVANIPVQTKYGPPATNQIDTRRISFQYDVQGQSYTGFRASADSRGLPYSLLKDSHFAHYRPQNPAIAVLIPTPYSGTFYWLASVFTGLLVASHLFFTITLRDR